MENVCVHLFTKVRKNHWKKFFFFSLSHTLAFHLLHGTPHNICVLTWKTLTFCSFFFAPEKLEIARESSICKSVWNENRETRSDITQMRNLSAVEARVCIWYLLRCVMRIDSREFTDGFIDETFPITFFFVYCCVVCQVNIDSAVYMTTQ